MDNRSYAVDPDSSAKNEPVVRGAKKLHAWVTPAIISGVVLMFAAILGVMYARANGTVIKDSAQQTPPIELNVANPYDSPIGFLPGFATVKSGRAKISIDNIGVAPKIEKDVAYYIDDDGRVSFDMLPDDSSVDGILTLLTEKTDGQKYNAETNGASRFMKLDFLSLFDLSSLQSTFPDLYNGLLAAYINDTAVIGVGSTLKPAKGIEACDTKAGILINALQATEMNTQKIALANRTQALDSNGNATLTFSVEPGFFTQIDTAITEFVDDCYMQSIENETDKVYLKQVVDRYTTHPSYVFKITQGNDGRRRLTIDAQYANPDTQATAKPANFTFELLTTGAPEVAVKQPVKSFFERPNLYGLVYSYCRVPPLVAKDAADAKILLVSPYSIAYTAPSSYDLAYACASNDDRLKLHAVTPLDTWKVAGRNVKLKPEESALALKHHDIAFALEQYFMKNGHYPSIEVVQAAQLPGLQARDLQDTKGQIINQGDITYTVEPENCSECLTYSLSYKVDANTTLKMVDYARQGSER